MSNYMIRKHPRKLPFKEVCGFNRLSYGDAIRIVIPNDDGEIDEENVNSEDFYEEE